MKVYNPLSFSISLLFLFFFSSCEDFMDIHKEYIDDGEIIYATRLDSVSFIAGKDRILFRGWLYNGVNVDKIIVSWNNGADEVSINAELGTGRDSVETMLMNMPEKSYTFEIYSIDNFGHKSLIVTDFGSSYGEIFASSLIDRRIKEVNLTDQYGMVDWFSAPEGMVFTEIQYVDNDGNEVVHRTSDGSFTSKLVPRPGSGTNFKYRCLFIPESESVDTFATEWIVFTQSFPSTFLYDRSDWEVLEVSDETASDGGGMNTLIDGNLSSYWHSNWQGESTPLPHWAIIDMKEPRSIASLDIYRRPGNTDSKTVQIFSGNDPLAESSDWVLIGEGVFESGDKLSIQSNSDFLGRYLKVFLPDSNRDPFISIAEIFVFGQ